MGEGAIFLRSEEKSGRGEMCKKFNKSYRLSPLSTYFAERS
ncbi:hypothetical protein COI_2324 [Mannheimia haemolytica serotype A2 str. OVINE]|nr:hypothetical protein COI_2324 [Mannheimia haemolytica serotype A2 str. OVINE]EEY12158.1 hypothetical protein COK_1745 [Mannheimia haemolytica serotype A2 str. BOVINE]